MNKMEIRKYQETDWQHVWPIIEKVFRDGETYAFSTDITEQDAHKVWIELPQEIYVVTSQDDEISGTYYIKPNQPGLGGVGRVHILLVVLFWVTKKDLLYLFSLHQSSFAWPLQSIFPPQHGQYLKCLHI